MEVCCRKVEEESDVVVGRYPRRILHRCRRRERSQLLVVGEVLIVVKTIVVVAEWRSGGDLDGRLTLLLGPPGSGKTTLLLALAGKLDSTQGELTVRETLAFFARCQVVGSRYDMRDRVLICCGEFTAFDKAQMVIPVKSKHDDDDNRSGGAIQLSTRGSSSGHKTPIGDVTHL
ncbi:hypothetical protein Ddye_005449 [Dipteronia dyeriana]|uniref:ABC transporter domain-containing protein n=1 Tax=Dipteronia dyeriana TaxID=168575 RepID=A0AAE0CPQ7_9ROSI|nr:hypothetical protein Ddye_005449 [Dipteronia dyeriana]